MTGLKTAATIALLALAAACGNTADGVKKDADNAGDKTAAMASDASAATGAAMETADVKTALMADARIDASEINVDTNKDSKMVMLNGTVHTAEQKTIAEEIAKVKAVGYAVQNNLTIKP